MLHNAQYPSSVFFLNERFSSRILKKKKIHSIFVLTSTDVIATFKELIPQLGLNQGILAKQTLVADGSNLAKVIKESLWDVVCNIQDEKPPYGWCTC